MIIFYHFGGNIIILYTEQIVKIIDRFKIRFIQIVEHCIDKENYNHIISDFDTNLDQDELNYITNLIEKI